MINSAFNGQVKRDLYLVHFVFPQTHMHTRTVCPPLTLVNGIVSYSMEMGAEQNVGNVATHTCISGYQLLPQGMGNTRICTISGWSGQDFMCGEYASILYYHYWGKPERAPHKRE